MRCLATLALLIFGVLFGTVLLIASVQALGLAPWQPYSPTYVPDLFGTPHSMHEQRMLLTSRAALTSWSEVGLIFFVLPVLVIGALVAVFAFFPPRSKDSKEKKKPTVDEARIVQEIYEGLARMESRVESLETILLERPERSPNYPETLKHEK